MSKPTASDNTEKVEDADGPDEELDRHRRRVLWALPTGLYLIGSRHDDDGPT